jgi:hypothetical protein
MKLFFGKKIEKSDEIFENIWFVEMEFLNN